MLPAITNQGRRVVQPGNFQKSGMDSLQDAAPESRTDAGVSDHDDRLDDGNGEASRTSLLEVKGNIRPQVPAPGTVGLLSDANAIKEGCIGRAMEFADQGKYDKAIDSFISDIGRTPSTAHIVTHKSVMILKAYSKNPQEFEKALRDLR